MKLPLLITLGILSGLSGTAQIQINGSYLNISRPTGGPVSFDDIIEIRAVISVPSGTTVSNLYYTDNIPAGTSFITGSLKVVTNENQVNSSIPNTGAYTNAVGDDRGQLSGTAITIYMGTNATASAGGTVIGGTTTPVFQTSASILMVAYQVKVTAAEGLAITTAGIFHYTSGGNQTVSVPSTSLVVSPYYSCPSTAGGNLVTDETGGTFNSGTSQTRGTPSSGVTGYTFTTLAANAPVDGQYTIVKNTSPTQYTGTTPTTGQRVFGVWDVIGDHTNAATAAGNTPAGSGASGGYLLAVNATFIPASIFKTTISGLVANNVYTISFWVRNLCGTCANNPVNGSALTTSGVKPNVAINLNGKNYYSSGDIDYTNEWVQKSFTFQNGASTSAVFEVKNNAPGGGGNDWAMDDISMKQCAVVLPVGLQSFEGRQGSQGIRLDWQVTPWPELYSFVVERSTDGIRFVSIGEVTAARDSSRYQFIDRLLPASGSRLYYRIRLVNNDGTTDYSTTLTLNTGNDPVMLITHLAPNPARTMTTLAIATAHAGTGQVTLWSPSGRLLSSRWITLTEGTNTVELTMPAHLPAGIYIIRTTSSGESAVSRLIVE